MWFAGCRQADFHPQLPAVCTERIIVRRRVVRTCNDTRHGAGHIGRGSRHRQIGRHRTADEGDHQQQDRPALPSQSVATPARTAGSVALTSGRSVKQNGKAIRVQGSSQNSPAARIISGEQGNDNPGLGSLSRGYTQRNLCAMRFAIEHPVGDYEFQWLDVVAGHHDASQLTHAGGPAQFQIPDGFNECSLRIANEAG